ncbi:MAG: DUF1080 domain-containing protein [Planctomycetes bacterium]|nr:DUF1080 domain-containing protein [Planctomycetota bacterium]
MVRRRSLSSADGGIGGCCLVKMAFIVMFVGLSWGVSVGAAEKFPFMGDWVGRWNSGDGVYPSRIEAQVIAWKKGSYQIHFYTELRKRAPEYVVIEARAKGGVLNFENGSWSGRIEGDRFTGEGALRGKSGGFEMSRVFYESPRLGAKAPRGAVVLFDGSSFDEWEMIQRGGKTGPVTWKIEKGVMRIVPEFGNHKIGVSIGTKRGFGDFKLHIEFRLPLLAENTDQRRGNSGVIIEEFQFFEIQVLDCYGLAGYYDECGAIYHIRHPDVNMCLMPLQWQSYDITYRAPRFDRKGDLTESPRITVDHNGELIHRDYPLPYSDNAVRARRERPESRKVGRIKLQDHGYPVEYRNIWIVEDSTK